MAIKKESFLCIAIAIPLIMIVVTIIAVYQFQKKLLPQQNFIYVVFKNFNDNVCLSDIEAQLFPGKIRVAPAKLRVSDEQIKCNDYNLYVYDFKTDKSYPITVAKAKDIVPVTPYKYESDDGYRIDTYCHNDADWMGWGVSGNNDYCIIKDNYKKKINIDTYSRKDNNYFVFLAWLPIKGMTHDE